MLALSPPVFPTPEWPLEDPLGIDQISYFCRETQPATAAFLPSYQQELLLLELDHQQSTSFTAYNSSGGDANDMVKKLNHNASERDRRKKMNTLYSSLRSLFPAADEMKKLSIPATISRVLKYIPELQEQLERLVQRKEEILLRISKQNHIVNPQINQRKGTSHSSLSVVSANQISDKEAIIQISTYSNTIHTSPLSEILLLLEEEGLLLINSSSAESFGGRVFNNLHVQVDDTYTLECDALSEKLASLYAKRDGLFP
ncbi:transcription factor ORG2 [Ricinus communis]|uniref:DNA binding protein, putative n=1 Tax=Ricinus communis TaxID=3988 RepID=B9SZX1_RICCO|nr:transcription factor ORG2 [Ricinus communis]EEF30834.1 DNA binding protein, putative [Ricinus communis]|eukprot:XP_002531540.1 transcription factor ORG2 [Ricinus communis]